MGTCKCLEKANVLWSSVEGKKPRLIMMRQISAAITATVNYM